MKFYGNPSSRSRADTCGRTNGRTDRPILNAMSLERQASWDHGEAALFIFKHFILKKALISLHGVTTSQHGVTSPKIWIFNTLPLTAVLHTQIPRSAQSHDQQMDTEATGFDSTHGTLFFSAASRKNLGPQSRWSNRYRDVIFQG
jgi:hypothetical protein